MKTLLKFAVLFDLVLIGLGFSVLLDNSQSRAVVIEQDYFVKCVQVDPEILEKIKTPNGGVSIDAYVLPNNICE